MEERKKIGFILGPFLFLLTYFLPFLPQNSAHHLLAIFSLVVVWWVTECIPIPITALLIPVLITAFRVAPIKQAFAPFANPIIIAISKAASINPLYPVMGSALACSFAFLLPVATPPNAIIYGSGMIRIPQMLRYGIQLEIAGIILLWGYITLVLPSLGIF